VFLLLGFNDIFTVRSVARITIFFKREAFNAYFFYLRLHNTLKDIITIILLYYLSVIVTWNSVFVKPLYLKVVIYGPLEVCSILIFFFLRSVSLISFKFRGKGVKGLTF